jgi:hypothetical protein
MSNIMWIFVMPPGAHVEVYQNKWTVFTKKYAFTCIVVQTGRLQIMDFETSGCCPYVALTVCSLYIYDQAPRNEVL